MNPDTLKQWQSTLGLSELAMAEYLGIPIHTFRGWIRGTRAMDAAPLRLINVLQRVRTEAPTLHARLIEDARASAPVARPVGRPKGSGRATPAAPAAEPSTDLPAWLSGAI